jgi:hypothetical protein
MPYLTHIDVTTAACISELSGTSSRRPLPHMFSSVFF